MKIAFIADCHLNKTSYSEDNVYSFTSLPFRSQDFMNSLEYMVNNIINDVKPDMVAFLGDIFDSFEPTRLVSSFFCKQLRRLNEANIPSLILVGNHDICSKYHALKDILEMRPKNTRVIENAESFSFKDYFFICLPHTEAVEKKEITMREQFLKLVKESNEKIESDPKYKNMKRIFMGHFGVRGACLNKYEENEGESKVQKDFINKNVKDISVEDLDMICADYVFLGDYHRHQILNTRKCHAMYIGSIERTDISEKDEDKGFVVFDDSLKEDEKYGTSYFVKYPNVRPMARLSGDLVTINKLIDKMDEKYEGAIIQIIVEGDRSEIIGFDNIQSNILSRLESKINPICVMRENKISNKEDEEAVKNVDKIMVRNEDVSKVKINVMEIVHEMLMEREKDEVELSSLIKESDSIYETVRIEKKGKA